MLLVLNYHTLSPEAYRIWELDHLSIVLSTTDYICFDKNLVWVHVHYNTSACDFASVVLIRTLPGALGSLTLPTKQSRSASDYAPTVSLCP